MVDMFISILAVLFAIWWIWTIASSDRNNIKFKLPTINGLKKCLTVIGYVLLVLITILLVVLAFYTHIIVGFIALFASVGVMQLLMYNLDNKERTKQWKINGPKLRAEFAHSDKMKCDCE